MNDSKAGQQTRTFATNDISPKDKASGRSLNVHGGENKARAITCNL